MKESNVKKKLADLISMGLVREEASGVVESALGLATNSSAFTDQPNGSGSFGVVNIFDDSTSMGELGKINLLFSEHQRLVTELQGVQASSEQEYFYSSFGLNCGCIQPWGPLSSAKIPSASEFTLVAQTPLLGRTKQVLGEVLIHSLRYAEVGLELQTFITIISDGEYTDEAQHSPADLAVLIDELTRNRSHTVCGVAIGPVAREMFLKMGLAEKWIVDTTSKAFDFRSAFDKVSRLSRRAASLSDQAFEVFAESLKDGVRAN
jgi:hypothetical protein